MMRPIPISAHPLKGRHYRLPTPPIDALYTLVTDALDRRRPGVMVYGRSRLGKTTAIEYLEALLHVERPQLPIIILGCRYKRVPSEIAFFSNFLNAVRHKATSGRDTEQLRQRLVQRLCEMADSKKAHFQKALAFRRPNSLRASQTQVLHRNNFSSTTKPSSHLPPRITASEQLVIGSSKIGQTRLPEPDPIPIHYAASHTAKRNVRSGHAWLSLSYCAAVHAAESTSAVT